jgi:hypothetical protein
MTKTDFDRGARVVWRFVLALGISMALVPASVFAQSPTFVRSDYPLATNDLIAADLNGDGRPDLAGIAASGAAVLLGNGDGTFQPIVTYPVFSWSQALTAGDFNGDGRVDLIVTINDINIGLSLLTGRGDGTFNPAVRDVGPPYEPGGSAFGKWNTSRRSRDTGLASALEGISSRMLCHQR